MKTLFLITGLFICGIGYSQNEKSANNPGRNSFYAELGGPGILFSANIDRRFTNSSTGFGGRVGLGFVTGSDILYNNLNNNYRQRSVVTFPLQLNYVFGKSRSSHLFEVGAGVTIAGKKLTLFDYDYNNIQGSSVFGTASFMYRKIARDGGFSWRIGFTPIIAQGYIQPSAGVSIGYNF